MKEQSLSRPTTDLVALSDEELLSKLAHMIATERGLVARIVACLVEVEERRLDLKTACPSLLEFCVTKLGLSQNEAYRRMIAARLARRFPVIIAHLERGDVHLSGLVLLRDYLTAENHAALLAEAAHKSKIQLQELIARRFPRPDVPPTLTPLDPPNEGPPSVPGATPPVGPEPPGNTRTQTLLGLGALQPARLEPLAPGRYRLEMTVSGETRTKLERLVALMRHRNPTGDLAVVVDQAFDALLVVLEKERLGKTSRPQRPRAAKPDAVSQSTRREVFERDGEQCSFRDAEGNRCPARDFLELDHVEARALGGSHDPANLRVRCRRHNRLAAEETFGREHVEDAIRARQRKSRLDLLERGLKGLGFGERRIQRALAMLDRRFASELPSNEHLLREAFSLLT